MRIYITTAVLFLAFLPGVKSQKVFNAIEKEKYSTGAVQNLLDGKISRKDVFSEQKGKITKANGRDSSIFHEFSIVEWAAVQNSVANFELLLKNQDKLAPFMNVQEEVNKSVAHFAGDNNTAVFPLLLKYKADLNSECITCFSRSPMQIAAFYKSFAFMDSLEAHGVSLAQKHANGTTLLHFVLHGFDPTENRSKDGVDINKGVMKKVDELCKKGLDPNEKDKAGISPYMYTFYLKDLKYAKQLHALGGKINTADDKEMYEVLDNALSTDKPANLLFLEESTGKKIAPAFFTELNGEKDSPLNNYVQYMEGETNPQLIRELVKRGVDVNQVGLDNMTPLDWAVLTGNERLAEVMVDAGGKVNNEEAMKKVSKVFKNNKTLVAKIKGTNK